MPHSLQDEIIAAARAAHEANRAYCIALGDVSQPSWDDAPEWQRDSAIAGVNGVIKGNTPEQSHESWMAQKIADGWEYGPTKDPSSKKHPCIVPYAALAEEQKQKDHIFVAVVRAVLSSFNRFLFAAA